MASVQTTGFDHVGVHPQLNLPRNSQDLPVRNVQARSRLMDLRARDQRDPQAPLPTSLAYIEDTERRRCVGSLAGNIIALATAERGFIVP
jgi:hypothetical protein